MGLVGINLLTFLLVLPIATGQTPPAGAANQGAGTLQQVDRSIDLLREDVAEAVGEQKLSLQIQLLRHLKLPIQEKLDLAVQIIEANRDLQDPRILGYSYLAKGTAQCQLGQLPEALETLKVAEEFGKQCANSEPEIFFNARCNRAAFSMGGGATDGVAVLLNEAIEFARPFGNRLAVGHTYVTLAHLAESSGATNKALEFLQDAFEHSVAADKPNIAGIAVETIVSLLHGEQQSTLAAEWIKKGEPWIAKCDDLRIKFSFEIRKAEVEAALGDSPGAVERLEALLATENATVDGQLVGIGYLALADILLANSQPRKRRWWRLKKRSSYYPHFSVPTS